MNFSDRFSLSLHRRIAERLRVDPASVLDAANENLDKWLSKDSFAFGPERRALLEWKAILERSSPREIESIIVAETDEESIEAAPREATHQPQHRYPPRPMAPPLNTEGSAPPTGARYATPDMFSEPAIAPSAEPVARRTESPASEERPTPPCLPQPSLTAMP